MSGIRGRGILPLPRTAHIHVRRPCGVFPRHGRRSEGNPVSQKQEQQPEQQQQQHHQREQQQQPKPKPKPKQ